MNARAIECPFCGSGLFPNCCFVAQYEHSLEQRAAVRREAKEKTAREDARSGVDFIARLADVWDCRGNFTLRPTGVEHRALLQMARLPLDLAPGDATTVVPWSKLTSDQRRALLFAAKAAIQLARQCAWIFGEGQGAR